MKIFRISLSVLMVAVGLFFALGDLVATPSPAVAIIFAVVALGSFAGAFFTWPRRIRPWRLDAMLHGL